MNRSMLKALELGFAISGMILFGALGGIWLDQWLNTTPICTFIGIFGGVASAFKYLLDWTKEN
ncbi:MAG TPA: hypothetical protein DEA51_07230 [Erysipelotrichaceae bacterium]|nr:hypothetical protein [Erysipelotrichaceae bacterium]